MACAEEGLSPDRRSVLLRAKGQRASGDGAGEGQGKGDEAGEGRRASGTLVLCALGRAIRFCSHLADGYAQRRIQAIKDKRAKKEERERYEKMAEKMHRKRVERLKRKEKRNKLLNS